MDKKYIAEFRQGSGPMGMNAIDFYYEDGKIIREDWSMGGASKEEVESVPTHIEGYVKLNDH